MDKLKPCPFCGNLLEIVHKNGSKYVRCISGTCIFETARHGYHISDDELIKRCNRRPAGEALTEKLELFRQTLAEVAKMAIDSEQERIYEKCRDVLRDVYLEEVFKEKFDKILHGEDTEAPAKESEGKR